jgi:hypothetical protein
VVINSVISGSLLVSVCPGTVFVAAGIDPLKTRTKTYGETLDSYLRHTVYCARARVSYHQTLEVPHHMQRIADLLLLPQGA